MRDDALRRQQRGEVSYEVQDIENFDCSASNAAIGRRVWGSHLTRARWRLIYT
jgi:hypothetical protein